MTTHRPAPRPDVRLDDGAMEPVTCTTCSARVEVRKSSWQQTSVQWDAASTSACAERREATPLPGPNGGFFESCSALQASIQEAATGGVLPVPDDGY